MTYQTLTITKEEAAYIIANHSQLSIPENIWQQTVDSPHAHIVNLKATDSNQKRLTEINHILNCEGPLALR